MRYLVNELLRGFIRLGLYLYYKELTVHGKEHIKKDKAVLFVPNHQNGLIDPLLVGTLCKRKPYYLARSDVFKKPLYNRLLRYIQMLPIYRIRDGRDTLVKNEAIYKTCGNLLNQRKSIVIFPEGNHGIHRKVRPLKNGFIHILQEALALNPQLEIYLQPVGFNYQALERFPDRASLIIGPAIEVQSLWDFNDYEKTKRDLKKAVHDALCQLTTHIPNPEHYDAVMDYLQAQQVDFTQPDKVNQTVKEFNPNTSIGDIPYLHKTILNRCSKALFYMLNFPWVYVWRKKMKPETMEIEFVSTFRFAFALVGYLVIALLGLLIGALVSHFYLTLGILLAHLAVSYLLKKGFN